MELLGQFHADAKPYEIFSFYKEIMNSFHKTFLGLRVLRKACEDKVLREAPDQQPRQRRLSVSSMRKGRQSPSSSGKTHQELSQRVSLLHQFHFLIKHLFLIFILLCFIWLAFFFFFCPCNRQLRLHSNSIQYPNGALMD